jgi:protein tyrosine/serine phosphatase
MISRVTGRMFICAAAMTLAAQLGSAPLSASGDVSTFEKKFVEIIPGKVYSGIQPGSDKDYAFLKSRGIKTHLNLRKYLKFSEKTMRERAIEHGFLYRHAGMPTMWNKPKDPEVEEALSDLSNVDLQPIYVHCRLGKDRTGMIVALYRVLYEKWDGCDAWKEWKGLGYKPWNSGLRIYYEKRLRTETTRPNFDPKFSVSRCDS